MLRIKVFQNGLTRIYMTDSFKLGSGKNEFYNFLEAVTNVNLGHKKLIGLEDADTNAKVFVSPITCLIECEEVIKDEISPKKTKTTIHKSLLSNVSVVHI